MSKIAVVIPNWNGASYLNECLKALAKQTVSHTVYVVDNGSTDESRKVIEKYKAKGIYLDKNYGFAGGVNRGIEFAKDKDFEFIFLINNDAKPHKDALKHLLATINKDEKIGAVTGKFLTADGNKLDSTGEFFSTWGLPYPRGRGSTEIDKFDKKTELFGSTGGATLYRTALFDDIGLFDEDFFAYFEDIDLSFRAQLRGWRIVYEPGAEIYHRIGGTSSKIKGFATYQSFKNLPWLIIKNVPSGRLFWIILPRYMLVRFFFFGSALFKGEIKYAIKGDWDATRGLLKKWRERRQIQSSKTVSAEYIADRLYGGIPPNYNRLLSIKNRFIPSSDKSINRLTILIDLRVLDGASKFRGIGMLLHNLLNLLLPMLTEKYHVIICVHEPESLSGIDKEAIANCEIRIVKNRLVRLVPKRIYDRFNGLYPSTWRAKYLPVPEDVDLFFQTYIENGLIKGQDAKSLAIAYDLIPLIFSEQYFHFFGLGRRPYGLFIRATRTLEKLNYKRGIQLYRKADKVMAISNHTKKTLIDKLSVKGENISISYPGVPPDTKESLEKDFKLPDGDYVVYVGGIDYRRDIVGLIEALEILHKQKRRIKLVLAGKDFNHIHDDNLAKKLAETPVADQIIIYGFISEAAKKHLLQNALAMVYPTQYEGFGLPIVEAFRDKCPVITYKNSSVPEAGGNAAIYVKDAKTIAQSVAKLQGNPKLRQEKIEAGLEHFKKFTWEKSAKEYFEAIEELLNNDG